MPSITPDQPLWTSTTKRGPMKEAASSTLSTPVRATVLVVGGMASVNAGCKRLVDEKLNLYPLLVHPRPPGHPSVESHTTRPSGPDPFQAFMTYDG